ncbi:unnamed protein product [Phytophthora lilii]|uniref:Unnamed protein product n=1 Tax=Phytophthora lilii TaxID=2077276 RepID=A0A9W6TR10_9STRA|nr:unnamed protein product [Phytophthora lilii]
MTVETKWTVQFSKHYSTWYESSESYECLSISSCHHWEPALSVSWSKLPKKKFAIFYEMDTCRTGGKFFYMSRVADINGTHKFESPQAIRSVMIGEYDYYTRRPSVIYSRCISIQEQTRVENAPDASEAEGESLYDITWSSDNSSLSSNWSDALPNSLESSFLS